MGFFPEGEKESLTYEDYNKLRAWVEAGLLCYKQKINFNEKVAIEKPSKKEYGDTDAEMISLYDNDQDLGLSEAKQDPRRIDINVQFIDKIVIKSVTVVEDRKKELAMLTDRKLAIIKNMASLKPESKEWLIAQAELSSLAMQITLAKKDLIGMDKDPSMFKFESLLNALLAKYKLSEVTIPRLNAQLTLHPFQRILGMILKAVAQHYPDMIDIDLAKKLNNIKIPNNKDYAVLEKALDLNAPLKRESDDMELAIGTKRPPSLT